MPEPVLYRKYRPASFKEVLGQEAVVRTLEGALRAGRVAHAYLFAGSRGTGKTSVARIFAKALGVSERDIFEIDAASNTGVDDVRALTEAVHTLPFESPYKVYILDEAHMLSKAAFNALLKTLEEPPKHVIFILATTEPAKLPETVVSRCENHAFRKPTQKILKDVVLRVAKKESLLLEPASAELIALLGDGSFRDALGILQKVSVVSGDRKISPEEILTVTGAPRSALVNEFLSALQEGSADAGLRIIADAVKDNVEMKAFLKLLLEKVRFVLLLRFAPETAKGIRPDLSDEDFAFLEELAKKEDSRISSATLLTLLEAYDDTGRSYLPQLPLELAVIKIAEQDV